MLKLSYSNKFKKDYKKIKKKRLPNRKTRKTITAFS